MKLFFVVVVCFVAKLCDAQANSAKTASLMCFKNEESNKFEMRLTVKLNTDPQGMFMAINNTNYNMNPFVVSQVSPCNINYDANNKIYTVTSTVDLNANSNAQDANLCGRVMKTGTSMTWEWYFIHLSVANNEPLIEDIDRVYIAVCNSSELTSNQLTHDLTVSAPNLNQNVQQTQLSVTFKIQKKNLQTNVYTDIAANEILEAGTTVRLMGTYERGNNFDASHMVHSVYFYNIIVSPNSALSSFYQLINANGCANVNGNNRAPSVPNQGMKGSIVGTQNIHTTTDFKIWKPASSSALYFRTYYGRCYSGNTTVCTDPCLANTQVTEPVTGKRKRRQVQGEFGDAGEPGVATLVVYVRDNTNTAEQSSDTTVMIVVGTVFGAAVLVILAILVCVFTAARRKKTGKRKAHVRDLPVVVPNPNYKY